MSPRSKRKVYFFFKDARPSIPSRTRLKWFIEHIFKKENKKLGSLNYIFCSDGYLLKMNKQYLGHNYYTDILTFNLSGTGNAITAEIYISVDRVKENANQLNQSFSIEFHRVIFHGALHLCGYNDKKKAEQLLIRKKEDHYLSAFFS